MLARVIFQTLYQTAGCAREILNFSVLCSVYICYHSQLSSPHRHLQTLFSCGFLLLAISCRITILSFRNAIFTLPIKNKANPSRCTVRGRVVRRFRRRPWAKTTTSLLLCSCRFQSDGFWPKCDMIHSILREAFENCNLTFHFIRDGANFYCLCT
jgi:hypothetical protein